MKKVLILLSLGLALIMLLLLVALNYLAKQPQEKSATCQNIPLSEITSQRSLGLLMSNRQLLAIKLSNEKNFSPPGGHTSGNEEPKSTLNRELKEELAFSVDQENLSEYRVFCNIELGEIQRTYFYLIDAPEDEAINIVSEDDSLKWVSYSFVNDGKADQELKQALFYLKSDQLID